MQVTSLNQLENKIMPRDVEVILYGIKQGNSKGLKPLLWSSLFTKSDF